MIGAVEVLDAGLGVPHGFLGRRGGVSIGTVAGLNCGLGSGDDPAAIAENRARAVQAVRPGGTLVGVYQVHGSDAVRVEVPWRDDARPRADALVTDRPGIVLGILTADCAPILFADGEAGVVGAAHAGWRGALAGVTDNTIAAMETLGAQRSRISAAIGPCIAQSSYEVDEAFGDRFVADDPANRVFFTPAARTGHLLFDLPGYVAARLRRAGVATAVLGEDTYSQPDLFYSFRRATHRGEPDYGRQISLIAAAEPIARTPRADRAA